MRKQLELKPIHAVEVPPLLEHVLSCEFCGGTTKIPVIPEFDMVRCASCGLTYVDQRSREEDMGKIYGEHYFRSVDSQALGYDDYVGERENIAHTFRRRLRIIEERLGRKGGRLLDVGCATGFFLDVARDAGWEVQGVEISQFASDIARNELGLDVHHGFFTSMPKPKQPFDVITMWDYIEHSLCPQREFQICQELLRPGGMVVLTTPDMDSWPARIFGRRWIGIKPHEHFFYYSRRTLSAGLEAAGLNVEEISTVGKYVTVEFFIKRIGHYSPAISRGLRGAAGAVRLLERSLYVDPRDLMIAFARKPPG